MKLIDGEKWGLHLGPTIPSNEPVQSVVFDKGGPYGPSNFAKAVRRTKAPEANLMLDSGSERNTDPRASCG